MGLAGTRNRRKLAVDPNNTKWTKDETTFGQRILRAHGWQPGQYLGPQDSSHASLLSAASSAPIKITLKDDTLGLGAKVRQKQSDQCTGLDVFKDLLGRLNGESDESIEKKKALRSDLKTSLYVERKFGSMRFVKGGLLVGDQITELLNKTADVKQTAANVPTEKAEAGDDKQEVKAKRDKKEKKEKKEKKSKKRKAEESDSLSESETEREERKSKKKKRSKDESTSDLSPTESTSDSEKKRRKKERKSKKSKKTDVEDTDGASDAKSKKKKDKKKRKEDRADDVAQPDADDSEQAKTQKKKRKHQDATYASDGATESAANSATGSGTLTPTGSGTSTPQPLGRALVRSRYLASKRSAIADMQALNQILFIKPV